MSNLLNQIVKFGFVGVLCFVIDFGLYKLCNFIGIPYLISGFIGFTVSVIVNYLLSMKFVFERREDMSRKREFIIFVILSVIGLGINELLLFIGIDGIYFNSEALRNMFSESMAETLVKLFATAVVMVYNFVTRKILLEKKD